MDELVHVDSKDYRKLDKAEQLVEKRVMKWKKCADPPIEKQNTHFEACHSWWNR